MGDYDFCLELDDALLRLKNADTIEDRLKCAARILALFDEINETPHALKEWVNKTPIRT